VLSTPLRVFAKLNRAVDWQIGESVVSLFGRFFVLKWRKLSPLFNLDQTLALSVIKGIPLAMIDARIFDDLSNTLGKLLPPGMSDVKEDFEQNAKAALQGALGKLDLVTREEFDVQTEILLNTRKQLKALEERIKILEGGADDGAA